MIYFEGDTVYICGGYNHERECYLNGKQKVSLILCTVIKLVKSTQL
jgi:hypothetical protein